MNLLALISSSTCIKLLFYCSTDNQFIRSACQMNHNYFFIYTALFTQLFFISLKTSFLSVYETMLVDQELSVCCTVHSVNHLLQELVLLLCG